MSGVNWVPPWMIEAGTDVVKTYPLFRIVEQKDGKEHRYWNVVENRRIWGGGWFK